MTPRVAMGVAGLLALVLPLPSGGVHVLTVIGLLALGYSLMRPGSAGPAFVIMAAILSWLATPAGSLHALRLVGLALAISVLHASAGLAALVPRHARVPGGLALRWVGWAAVTTTVGAGALGAASLISTSGTTLPVTVAAVALAAIAGAVAVASARPRDLSDALVARAASASDKS